MLLEGGRFVIGANFAFQLLLGSSVDIAYAWDWNLHAFI